MYYRWVTTDGNPRVDNEGIFQKATHLREGVGDHELIDKIILKFNHHLHVPKNIKQLKHGIFWFKQGSDCIKWAAELADAMGRLKVKTICYRTAEPGKIIFEDGHQVIAVYNRRVKCRIVDFHHD